MQPFLEKAAEHIFQNYKNDVSELRIVLPNKRAGLFLKKYLAAKFRQTIWSPKIYSIEDFIAELSGVVVPEPMTLLLEFYNVYKKVEGENAQTPDEFIRWGNVLLNDFNEIDMYCADAKKLFGYLNEIRAIEQWNPQTRELSDFQKQYLNFWQSLGKLYDEFSNHLLQKNQAYQGLAYRIAAEKVGSQKTDVRSQYLFVGFNALTKSEEIIIRHFLSEGKAEILWDADKYYLENKNQEAGKFLRKYKKSVGSWQLAIDKENEKQKMFNWEFDILGRDEKEIEIIGVAGNVTQAKAAGDILSTLEGAKDFQSTAVVLADESLLLPVLESLPAQVKNVNVTMGYPLKHSPLHDFWNSLFQLHENAYSSSGKQRFYHKNIIHILSHPFILFSEEMAGLSHQIISEIKNKNRIYLSEGELREIAEESGKTKSYLALEKIFSDWNSEPPKAIETALFLVKLRIGEKNMESEFLARYLEIFNELQLLIDNYKDIRDLRTLRIIFNQIAGSYKVPFSGEPLQGLQVMGVLETRTLDFETVIMLSANEDVIPSGKSQNSFIPFDVKKQFGLPLYSDRDAIFAYHFYRLLQRAKKIFLLYNNDTSKSFGSGGSEKSRFITQLQEELPKINPQVKITEKILSFPSAKNNQTILSISKNEQIIMRLNQLSEKGFSPTAINTFLNCPLDFYFKYVVGLREEQEVEETIEAATFGDFVHASLQKLYSPFTGKKIYAEDIVQMKQVCDEITKMAFLSEYNERDISFGKNLLTLKVAQKFIRSFLNSEIEFLQKLETTRETLTILELEKEIHSEISVDGKKIKIKGKADRIDKTGDIIRIIDYKTGEVKSADVSLESGESFFFGKQKPKALQLLMYALIYSKQISENEISPAIISLKSFSGNFFPLKIDGSEEISSETIRLFEEELKKIISEIFDLSLSFEHNHDSKYCEFCCS